ncbi:DUF1272 domain-containing protein [Arthrobacter sp. UYCu712]|uniref:DUF1272 domain-containing protein n=1 Tax=Arthrobacter sp. UYCu712 TaxID=3156340 RepID=UPI003394E366
MLEIRPNCECCNRDIAPADEAFICTFECTWCPSCVERFPNRACPNCGGNLQLRPTRPAAALVSNPPSTVRVVSPRCYEQLATI